MPVTPRPAQRPSNQTAEFQTTTRASNPVNAVASGSVQKKPRYALRVTGPPLDFGREGQPVRDSGLLLHPAHHTSLSKVDLLTQPSEHIPTIVFELFHVVLLPPEEPYRLT